MQPPREGVNGNKPFENIVIVRRRFVAIVIVVLFVAIVIVVRFVCEKKNP